MRSTDLAVYLTLLALAAAPRAPAKEKPDEPGCALVPPAGFPPVTDAERALKDVPFAPGSPAVWLLRARTDDWQDIYKPQSLRMHLRLKILDDDGARTAGTLYVPVTEGGRVLSVAARTIRADGGVVDAADGIHRIGSPVSELRVVFPAVEPGAILDFVLEGELPGYSLGEWVVQTELPTLRAVYVLDPPRELVFRVGALGLSDQATRPATCTTYKGPAYVWELRDVPALESLPWSPPHSLLAQKLVIVMDRLVLDPRTAVSYAGSWGDYQQFTLDHVWDPWLRKKADDVVALARDSSAGADSAHEKAQSVRRALDAALDVSWESTQLGDRKPNDVLASGKGTLQELVGVHVLGLRAAGLDACPVLYRRRNQGPVPEEGPIPFLLDRALVRVKVPNGSDLWYVPDSARALDRVPLSAGGVLALPVTPGRSGPVRLPELTPEDAFTRTEIEAEIQENGDATGTLRLVLRGARAAEKWADLAPRSEQSRRDAAGEILRGILGAGDVTSPTVTLPARDGEDLVITAGVSLGEVALRSGSRLMVQPLPAFARVEATDWPPGPRRRAIWMDTPHVDEVEVRWTLPEGTTDVTVPGNEERAAPGAGRCELAYDVSEDGRTVEVRRRYRLDQHVFSPESWNGLRSWHLAIAALEDRLITGVVP